MNSGIIKDNMKGTQKMGNIFCVPFFRKKGRTVENRGRTVLRQNMTGVRIATQKD
jgi:hypothetical protein